MMTQSDESIPQPLHPADQSGSGNGVDAKNSPVALPTAGVAGGGVPEDAAPLSETVACEHVPAEAKGISGPNRRDFFAKLMRDAVGPIAAILEHRMGPVTDALQGKALFSIGQDDVPLEPPDSYSTAVHPRTILRPPGALASGDFEFACSRCAKCVEVCPVKAIQLDTAGSVAGGFPYIVPEISPCVVCEDLACMKNCPTGALVLVEKAAIRIGLADVDHQQCLRASGEDCHLCMEACPADIHALVISSSSGKVLVKLDRCIGCGLCENACPTEPRAIVVNPRPRLEDPIIA